MNVLQSAHVPVHALPPALVAEQSDILPEGQVVGRAQLLVARCGTQVVRAEGAVDAPAQPSFDLAKLEERRGEVPELVGSGRRS